jgi:CRISPR-associated protein Cas5t
MFIVSYQPTYRVPPVSTIYGLLSAAKGEKVSIYDIPIGYFFISEGSGIDLESIWQYGGETKTKSAHVHGKNIVSREFLYNCTLMLYLPDLKFEKYFRNPKYPLVLGRQCDLAMIKKIDKITVVEKENSIIKDTMIPFDPTIAGQVVSLPSDYTDFACRSPVEVKTYSIVTTDQLIEKAYFDDELQRGFFLHDFRNQGKE